LVVARNDEAILAIPNDARDLADGGRDASQPRAHALAQRVGRALGAGAMHQDVGIRQSRLNVVDVSGQVDDIREPESGDQVLVPAPVGRTARPTNGEGRATSLSA